MKSIKRTPTILRLMEKSEGAFDKQYKMSRGERNAFLESIRNYEAYGQAIYRGQEIGKAVQEISDLVESAAQFTLDETEGWFDEVTATRHGKQMREALKVLQTEANESMKRQQRLEAAYEDIGQILGRYYEV